MVRRQQQPRMPDARMRPGMFDPNMMPFYPPPYLSYQMMSSSTHRTLTEQNIGSYHMQDCPPLRPRPPFDPYRMHRKNSRSRSRSRSHDRRHSRDDSREKHNKSRHHYRSRSRGHDHHERSRSHSRHSRYLTRTHLVEDMIAKAQERMSIDQEMNHDRLI